MKVKFYGTRGSIPISNSGSVKYGGNTTCLRIISDCLPDGMWLIVDAGSGFKPLSDDAMKAGIKSAHIFFSHYHWDHTQGLPLGSLTFMKHIPITLWGPVDKSCGPKEMMEASMQPPYFPKAFAEVASHFRFKEFEHPTTKVIVIHPEGGIKQMNLDQFEEFEKSGKPLPIGDGRYPKSECLIIRMYRTYHPEQTISYRFEEGPTGKVFTFLTDHENQAGIPNELRAHLANSDLLVMDGQYLQVKYDNLNFNTAGWGHGTPAYCVWVASVVKAKKLGLTHHDPSSDDNMVEKILAEATAAVENLREKAKREGQPEPEFPQEIFACADYQEIEIN